MQPKRKEIPDNQMIEYEPFGSNSNTFKKQKTETSSSVLEKENDLESIIFNLSKSIDESTKESEIQFNNEQQDYNLDNNDYFSILDIINVDALSKFYRILHTKKPKDDSIINTNVVKKNEFIVYQNELNTKINEIIDFVEELDRLYKNFSYNYEHIIQEQDKKIRDLQFELEVFKSITGLNNDNLNNQKVIEEINEMNNMVELYPSSKITINRKRLHECLKNKTIKTKASSNNINYATFVSKIFTSIVSVEDVFMRKLKGKRAQSSTDNSLKKKQFSEGIHSEIHNCVKYHFITNKMETNDILFKDTENEMIKNIDLKINAKLSSLNKHFQSLINNEEPSYNGLLKEDLIYLKNYDQYEKNPKLFDNLLNQLYSEEELLLKNRESITKTKSNRKTKRTILDKLFHDEIDQNTDQDIDENLDQSLDQNIDQNLDHYIELNHNRPQTTNSSERLILDIESYNLFGPVNLFEPVNLKELVDSNKLVNTNDTNALNKDEFFDDEYDEIVNAVSFIDH